MQEFNYKGQNNVFEIVHNDSKLDEYVKMSFLRLCKGEIEIFYENLGDKEIVPEKSLIFKVGNKQGEIIHLYLLSRLKPINIGKDYIKYKIGQANLHYELED